ncbi:MAG: tRNA (5-methylaminomethyl-2-thiouridine)(34)-methyltransferase MnmD [Sphingobacteriaceae bacterium]
MSNKIKEPLPTLSQRERNLTFVETADGSKTVYNEQIGENYHSKNGAVQESRHVFLNAGLLHFLKQHPVSTVSILEIGFGTGLNFLLSDDFCTENQLQLNYTGIEAFPLDLEMIRETGYQLYVSGKTWESFLANYNHLLNQPIAISPYCTLAISPVKLLEYQSVTLFDIIYFDAFAVSFQPEMWDEISITHALSFLKPGGVFVTYAITGNLKRCLKSLGCTIEKIPGALGKREMLRATKND